MEYYFQVVDYQEEFSLLPDTGLTYGYRVYGKNTDIIEDCLYLADMEPSYGEMDQMVKDLAGPLKAVMDACSSISGVKGFSSSSWDWSGTEAAGGSARGSLELSDGLPEPPGGDVPGGRGRGRVRGGLRHRHSAGGFSGVISESWMLSRIYRMLPLMTFSSALSRCWALTTSRAGTS